MDDHPERRSIDGLRLAGTAASTRVEREASLRALHVLEFALAAPAPRRQRAWLHRVLAAVDTLSTALDLHRHGDGSLGLLEEVALCHPEYATRIERLRHEQQDLRIATSSLREQIEPDPEIPIDPGDVRTRLADLATRYRQHRAREADLIYNAIGVEVDAPPSRVNDDTA